MRIRKPTLVVAALATALLALSVPSIADAKKHLPPGSSQLDQYIETLPGPSGGKPAGSVHGGGGNGAVPPSTATQLQNAGAAGQATASLAQETVPGGSHGSSGHEAGGGSGTQAGAGSAESGAGQVTKAVLGSDSGGEGMGLWLLLILALITVAGAGYVLRGRLQNRAAG